MKPRIILLTQWFDPEPTFKGIVFARELQRQGYDVEVVTGFPNYPGGKVYPGYRIKWLQREQIDGVSVTRVPLYPSHDHSAVKRILNYASFALSSLIYGVFFARRADVIYTYHPPLTVGVAAAIIKFFRRTPVVYDIQDMWPDTLRATGMLSHPKALRMVEAVCHWVYRRMDHIVVLSPGFKRVLVSRGVPEKKIDVIYNWADEASLQNQKKDPPPNFPAQNHFRIVFAGNMGAAQALRVVLDAAAMLQAKKSPVCWVMLGGGVEAKQLKAEAEKKGLVNVVFLPPVPMSGVGAYLHHADALLVHLRKDPLFEITIPSKTQAYMAVGKPILMAVNGDASDLVRDAECGVLADSENADSLAAAAEKLASMSADSLLKIGDKAVQHYREHLSLEQGVGSFDKIFKKLILLRRET